MGLTGVHLLVLLVPVVLLVGVAVGVYFLIKKAVAAGVREGRQNATAIKRSSPDR